MNKQRLILIIIFALFFIPIFSAIFLHSQWSDFSASKTKNLGNLVVPVQPLEPFLLKQPDGGEIDLDSINGRWQLVYLVNQHCDQSCMRSLTILSGHQQTLGQNSEKVGLLLVTNNRLADNNLKQITAISTQIKVIVDPNRDLLAQFAGFMVNPSEAKNQVYLLDPMGNIILYYPSDFEPTDIKKDLKRILRWSKVDTE